MHSTRETVNRGFDKKSRIPRDGRDAHVYIGSFGSPRPRAGAAPIPRSIHAEPQRKPDLVPTARCLLHFQFSPLAKGHRVRANAGARRYSTLAFALVHGVICPTGCFCEIAVQPPLQKYFAFAVGQIISTSSPRPASIRGALAIVTNVGCGMRWTR